MENEEHQEYSKDFYKWLDEQGKKSLELNKKWPKTEEINKGWDEKWKIKSL